MTPTGQDNELKDSISSIIYGADWKTELSEDAHLPQTEAIMEIVRKHELQARLEEYQQGLMVGAMPEFIGKPMAEKRIAELKQELEKL